MNMHSRRIKVPTLVAVVIFLFSLLSGAEEKREFAYKVGPKPVVHISNYYGPITVKPAKDGRVTVTMVSHSDAVSFEQEQHGDRIRLRASSPAPGSGLADYTVLVPKDAVVSLKSLNGTTRVGGLRGDLIVQSGGGTVEVRDMRGAHIHVSTLSGPVTLASIHKSYLEVLSSSGNVSLQDVTESSVVAHSGGGRITYDGDPGPGGDYNLTSHSGNVEVSIPASASVRITGRSLDAKVDHEPAPTSGFSAAGETSLLAQPRASAAPVFVLRSFRGKILVKRP